jgi:hypothetical protein
LHVHHRYYLRGKKPWEYDDDALTTLCEDCHDVITEITGSLKPQLGRLSSVQLAAVSGFALGVELSGLMFTGPLKASIAVPFAADSLEASGLAAGLGISRDDIDALAGRGPLTAEGIIELAETRAQDHARRLIEHGRFSVEGYYEDTLS